MARKSVHHPDLESLLAVNREVVLLTNEPHEFTDADGEKLKELVQEVRQRANNDHFKEAVTEKTALLVFKLASGQHFRGGNKRTALVAGLVFLRKNGYTINISDQEFVSTVDKAGIAAASLDDLYEVMNGLISKSTVERKSWEKAVKKAVEENSASLTEASS